jgi:hypothetical protein
MRHLTLLLAAAIGGLCAPSLWAQDTFETTSGSTYSGKVVSDDGTSIEIETTSGGKMKLPIESLTLESQYRLQRGKTADDAQSQVALAEWCVGKTLYEQARTHFRRALATDATMADEINKKVVVARKTAATELLQRAKGLQQTNPQESRRLLSVLVQELPLEEASTEARTLLSEDTGKRKKASLSAPKAPAADAAADDGKPRRPNGEPFSEETRALFQPVIESYEKMLDATTEGLLKGESAGIKEFEKALKEGEKISKAAEKLRPDAAGNVEIKEALDIVDAKLEEAIVDVRLNLVDNYMLRTSYNQAADTVKEGLAAYPKNERLRQAMNRVTAASADNGGGDWIIGRR